MINLTAAPVCIGRASIIVVAAQSVIFKYLALHCCGNVTSILTPFSFADVFLRNIGARHAGRDREIRKREIGGNRRRRKRYQRREDRGPSRCMHGSTGAAEGEDEE